MVIEDDGSEEDDERRDEAEIDGADVASSTSVL